MFVLGGRAVKLWQFVVLWAVLGWLAYRLPRRMTRIAIMSLLLLWPGIL